MRLSKRFYYLNPCRFPAVFSLAGVPKGQEETLEKAIDTYYVRGYA